VSQGQCLQDWLSGWPKNPWGCSKDVWMRDETPLFRELLGNSAGHPLIWQSKPWSPAIVSLSLNHLESIYLFDWIPIPIFDAWIILNHLKSQNWIIQSNSIPIFFPILDHWTHTWHSLVGEVPWNPNWFSVKSLRHHRKTRLWLRWRPWLVRFQRRSKHDWMWVKMEDR